MKKLIAMNKVFVPAKIMMVVGALMLTSAQAAEHPAATATNTILTSAMNFINSGSSSSRKFQEGCQFLRSHVHVRAVANEILGDYKDLQRDQRGVERFQSMFSSILLNRVFSQVDQAKGSKFRVQSNVRARDARTYEVPVNFTSPSGRQVSVKVIVFNAGSRWLLVDGVAFGFSGVQKFKQDIQGLLDEEYNKDPNSSLPVTEVVKSEMQTEGFITCR